MNQQELSHHLSQLSRVRTIPWREADLEIMEQPIVMDPLVVKGDDLVRLQSLVRKLETAVRQVEAWDGYPGRNGLQQISESCASLTHHLTALLTRRDERESRPEFDSDKDTKCN